VKVNPVVAGYDAVYAGFENSPTLQRLWGQHARGHAYPTGFEHLSFLTADELGRMKAELASGGRVVDVACGGGGPGLWVASQTGASLIGIDASRVALAHACDRAKHLGGPQAVFCVGVFDRLPIQTASADAVMSIDALQYAADKDAALLEIGRILRPGGRLAFTAFEVDVDRVSRLPVLGLYPVDDFRPVLIRAGFSDDVYEETERWHDRVTSTYQAVMRDIASLSVEMGTFASAALAFEATATLEQGIFRRRVFAVATWPGRAMSTPEHC
jgi:ubiquinone/menaquinone biosynthesis C-methylase UbiE